MPDIYLSTNPLSDLNQATHHRVDTGSTPLAFWEQHPELHEQMVICLCNRQPLLRAEWASPLHEHDVVLFVVRPRGGGQSNPLRLIAMLAVVAFAAWVVGPNALALSGLKAAGVKLGITMAGSMLVNQILPLPQPPASAKIPEPSPTYSLRGQSNTPRLGQPIPLHFGRHIIYPDLICQPWYEYDGNEQYYHLLGCLGCGKIVPERWQFGDLDFAQLPAGSVDYQVAYPGQTITLLPAVVYSADLSGVENANVTDVTVEVQARPVNDANTATAAWVTVITHVFSHNTVDTLRSTLTATVASGRYEVQARVTAAPSTDTKVRDKAIWGGLRGYSHAHPHYGDVTLVAVKLKASELLSQQSTQQVNLVATRHLKEWDNGWSTERASRSIVWALADLYLNANSGNQAPNTLLLTELQVLHNKLEYLNHHFDYRFDQSGQKLLEAMQIAARAGRCALFNHLGYWRITRDDERTAPVQMFTADNIRDFRLELNLPQLGEPDGIVGEFIDPTTWQAATITIPKAGVTTPVNPETVQLTGITDRAHAWAEITYMARAEGRRESGYLVTGMEGRIPIINDLIAMAPDGVNWGEWGSVVSQTGQTLTLSNPTDLNSGKIMLRGRDGKPLGTYHWTGSGTLISVVGVPTLSTGLEGEPCYYILGATLNDIVLGRVRAIERQADDYCKIEFVVEDSSVYGTVANPPPSSGGGGGNIVNPSLALNILWLRITEKANGERYDLTLTWSAVATAERYALELSTNGGSTWQRLYTGANLQYLHTAQAGAMKWRVAAIKGRRGAWYSLDYTVGSGGNNNPPPNGLGLQAAFVGAVCRIQWSLVAGVARYRLRIYDTATLTLRRSVDTTDPRYEYSYLMAMDDGGPWRQLTFRLWSLDAVGNPSASYAELKVSNPQVGALTNVQALGFQGQILITYDWPSQSDAAGVLVFMSEVAGFTPSASNQVYEGADTSIGIPSSTDTVKYIRVAGFDYWGQDQLTYSSQLSAKAGKFNPSDLTGFEPIPVVTSLPDPLTYNGYKTVSYNNVLYTLQNGVWVALSATVDPVQLNIAIQSNAIQTVTTLPNPVGYTGAKLIIFNGLLYQLNGLQWVSVVDASRLTGRISATQLANGLSPVQVLTGLPAVTGWTGSKVISVNGKLYELIGGVWKPLVDTSLLSGQITANQLANGLSPVQVLTALPAVTGWTGSKVISVNGKLYELIGGVWKPLVDTSLLSGQISASQLANGLSPVQVLTALPAVTGWTGSKVISVNGKLYELIGGVWKPLVDTSLLSGQITATQITDNSITSPKIAANAVTATHLSANSVVAGKIAANAVTAATIVAGAVVADKIAAGAVTTDKLTITGSNLIPNGDLNTGNWSNWRPYAYPTLQTVIAASTAGVPPAAPTAWVAQYDYTGVTVSTSVSTFSHRKAYSDVGAAQDGIAVSEGQSYRTEIWACRSSTATLQHFRVYAYFLKPDGTVNNYLIPIVLTTLPTTWTGYTGIITPPAGALRMWLYVYVAASAGQVYWANLRCVRMSDANLIVNGAVITDKIAAGAVVAGKVAANAITTVNIAANAITADKIAANAVTADKIAANAITAATLAAGVISADKIAAGAVATDKLAAAAVVADKIATGAITTDKLLAAAITADKIAAGAIIAGKIAANAITTVNLAANAITADKIAANAVTADKIAANSISAVKLAAGTITGDKIAANAITAANIQTGTLTGDKIAANTLGADKLIANSITADRLNVATLSAINANLGTITAGTLQNASGRAVFNLNATGAGYYLQLKNTLAQDVFRVSADGNVYIKGTIEATTLIASTAIIGTAMIQNGAVSSAAGAALTTTRTVPDATTTLQSVSVTGKSTGVVMVFVKCSGTAAPGSSMAGSSTDGLYQKPITLAIDLLVDNVVLETAIYTATGSSTTTPAAAGAWAVSFFAEMAAWTGSKTFTLRSRRVGSEIIAVAGNVTNSSIRVLAWSK